jgi:hypothetical protein
MSARLHATTVLVGERAVLIRGPSGAGKSALAWALLEHAGAPLVRLVADDQTLVEARGGRLLARPPAALAGLIERRGLGILRLPHEPVAAVGLVVDRGGPVARLPDDDEARALIEGVALPRLAVGAGEPDGAARVLLALGVTGAGRGLCDARTCLRRESVHVMHDRDGLMGRVKARAVLASCG